MEKFATLDDINDKYGQDSSKSELTMIMFAS